MSDENTCRVCGRVGPLENGVNLADVFCPYSYEVDAQVCAYPSGGYTMLIWSAEGAVEIPLNFCPSCGARMAQ